MSGVLLVAGAGRSGTSTVAGSLKLLGLHLPQPEVPADDTNPRGFFESQWVVDFHKDLLDRSPVVRTLDARPEAMGLAQQRTDAADARAVLDAWLSEQLGHPQVLVKDPRAFWFHGLWSSVAAGRGADVTVLTMLRHPVEVAQSRSTHYLADATDSLRRQRVTTMVAAWCNAHFVTEEVSRPAPRAYVRYPDLLADWRAALGPAVSWLGLEINADLTSGQHHPVDDFIDSSLRRSQTSWEEVDVPDLLRIVADGVWEQLNRLVETPGDPAALAALETLRGDYAQLHDHAVALATHHTGAREAQVRRNAKANTAAAYEQKIAELERQLDDARRSGPTGG